MAESGEIRVGKTFMVLEEIIPDLLPRQRAELLNFALFLRLQRRLKFDPTSYRGGRENED